MAEAMKEEKKEEKTAGKSIKNIFKKIKHNPWIAVSVILVIVLIIGVIIAMPMPKTSAGNKLVTFLNERVGGGVTLIDVESDGDFYEVTVSYQGQNIPVYMTKNGKYFVQGIEEIIKSGAASEDQTGEVPKSDKPIVELFVMSYCPYGTQAEKGLIPTLELLGNKIDAKVRFVHYVLHGDKETQENYRQLCIREEQGDKFLKYLYCTLDSSDPYTIGNVTKCMKDNGIDVAKVDDCIKNRAEEYYAEDSALSQEYGVQGSPTLIINGVESGAGRSPASYLAGICAAFNKAPSECSEELSSANPSPGFGLTASTNSATGNTAATC